VIVAASLPPEVPRPRVLEQLSFGNGCTRIHWAVDAKRLDTHNGREVSPQFEIQFPDQDPQTFQLTIYPTVQNDSKHGAGFKKAKGRGRVELKCVSNPPMGFPEVGVRVRAGKGSFAKAPRGPVLHNFAEKSCCGLAKSEQEWDFKSAVDESKTVTITVEIAPKALVNDFPPDSNVPQAPALLRASSLQLSSDEPPLPFEVPALHRALSLQLTHDDVPPLRLVEAEEAPCAMALGLGAAAAAPTEPPPGLGFAVAAAGDAVAYGGAEKPTAPGAIGPGSGARDRNICSSGEEDSTDFSNTGSTWEGPVWNQWSDSSKSLAMPPLGDWTGKRLPGIESIAAGRLGSQPTVPSRPSSPPGGSQANLDSDAEATLARTPVELEELPGGGARAVWTLPSRSLAWSNKGEVSPGFTVCLAGQESQTFQILLYPKAGRRRSSKTWEEANGRARVVLKCQSLQPSESRAPVLVRFGVGRGGHPRPTRGPVVHNFSEQVCCGLPKSEEEWDFKSLVDESDSVAIVVEVIPSSY